jgi:hypothetical protein
MHKTLGAISALIFLSGCVAEQPAKGAALTELQASCEAYGFKAGTDALSMCILQLDQQRMANARDKRMAVANSLQQMGAGMQANAPRQSNCTYNRIGNSIQQYCY